jgi:outer membrane protein assembly factor BamB
MGLHIVAPLLAGWFAASACTAAPAENWPQFRGPQGDGQAQAKGLPLFWSETRNIRWKTRIHDSGWSSPVIWDRQVWMTTSTADGKRLYAVCIDRDKGEVAHDILVFENERPQEIWSNTNGHASPTPVIEKGRIYVHFGSYGTACLDTASGQMLWTRRDLNCDHRIGPASSPILFRDLLILHVDGCDVQYVAALDKRTGKTVWKTGRSADYRGVAPGLRYAASTPTVAEVGGRQQLISPGGRIVAAYDALLGEELWKVQTTGHAAVPRPLVGAGLAFVVTDQYDPDLLAVRLDGRGDVTKSHVAWRIHKHGAPSVPSFLLAGDLLYLIADDGIATCLEARSGKAAWQERLGGSYYASPLMADGRIYAVNTKGVTTVLEAGRQFKVLSTNALGGDRVWASPAVYDKALFLRTETHLYRIEEESP